MSVKGSSKRLGLREGPVNEQGFTEEDEERCGTKRRPANSSDNRGKERPLVCDSAVNMLRGDGAMLIFGVTLHILGAGASGDKGVQNWCH